jgi:hypothetical protein
VFTRVVLWVFNYVFHYSTGLLFPCWNGNLFRTDCCPAVVGAQYKLSKTWPHIAPIIWNMVAGMRDVVKSCQKDAQFKNDLHMSLRLKRVTFMHGKQDHLFVWNCAV